MPTSRWLYWGGIAAAVCGAVLCVLGWYGVSGEPTAARQLPYLASATVPGAALLVAGAVLLAASARVRPPGAGGDGLASRRAAPTAWAGYGPAEGVAAAAHTASA
ncbi:hypothetical protein ACWDPI_39775, partial [Streptomyces zhihengii]